MCVRDGLAVVHERPNAKDVKQTLLLSGCGVIDAPFEGGTDRGVLVYMPDGAVELFEVTGKHEDELLREREDWTQAFMANVCGDAPDEDDGGSALLGDSRFHEQQRSGWATRVTGKRNRDLFFSLRHHSLVWYKSDQLADLKGSTPLPGCVPVLEGLRVTLLGSDEKVIVAFELMEAEEAAAWALALQEAIIEAEDEKGYVKFGWLERHKKRKWVALTRKQIFWVRGRAQEEEEELLTRVWPSSTCRSGWRT